jgi:programmed cell death protein 5
MADNLDDLRRRKLEQLQQQQQEQAQAQQQFDQIEAVIKQQFTPEALQRYGNIKVAHPETANQLIMIIAQLMNAGHIKRQIDDAALKRILAQLSQKREIKITRR